MAALPRRLPLQQPDFGRGEVLRSAKQYQHVAFLDAGIPRFFADDCKVTATDPDWNGVTWPAWFFTNNWHTILFYAVASRCTQPATPNCAAAGSLLTANGTPAPNDSLQALVIMPGRALGAQARPCAAVADCLEDVENTNGNFVYVNSTVSTAANDRLITVAP